MMGTTILWGGMGIASVYKKRVLFWEQMAALCRAFENEIRYTADSPGRIFERFCWDDTLWGQNFLSYCQRESAFGNIEKTLWLNGEQKRQITAFFAGLGTTDLEGQLAHCNAFQQVFVTIKEQASEQYQSKGKLTRTLSALLVIGVAVLAL